MKLHPLPVLTVLLLISLFHPSTPADKTLPCHENHTKPCELTKTKTFNNHTEDRNIGLYTFVRDDGVYTKHHGAGLDAEAYINPTHGSLMLGGILAIAPPGIFIARYFKETWTSTFLWDVPTWILAHAAYMSASIILMFAGVIMGILHQHPKELELDTTTSEDSTHKNFGWIVLVLTLIQYFMGASLTLCSNQTRKVIRYVHGIMGYVCVALGLIVILPSHLLTTARFPYFASALILTFMIVGLVYNWMAAYFYHKRDEKIFKKKDGMMKFYRAYIPLPLKKAVITLPGAATRRVLFLWYQFITAVFFAAIFIPYAAGRGGYSCHKKSVIQFDCPAVTKVESSE